MNTVVIEHVALSELPAAWRIRLPAAPNVRVTVRIEEEAERPALSDNPLFGMWQHREDVADVATFARQLRAPRYKLNGASLED